MGKQLERDLGLPSVTAISIGAMAGSGISILPGLAMKMAGPAVVFSYLLAGLLVLPAALSKSEMATAMPEAGGTYLYIERAMGPLFGTIAGVGTLFSLTFKRALAPVGGADRLVPWRRRCHAGLALSTYREIGFSTCCPWRTERGSAARAFEVAEDLFHRNLNQPPA